MLADSPFKMFGVIPILENFVSSNCVPQFSPMFAVYYTCGHWHFFSVLPWHVLVEILSFLSCSSISQECTEVKATMQNEKNLVAKFQNNVGIIFTTTKCSISLNVVLKHCWYLSHFWSSVFLFWMEVTELLDFRMKLRPLSRVMVTTVFCCVK